MTPLLPRGMRGKAAGAVAAVAGRAVPSGADEESLWFRSLVVLAPPFEPSDGCIFSPAKLQRWLVAEHAAADIPLE
jgi:hypothetical protein